MKKFVHKKKNQAWHGKPSKLVNSIHIKPVTQALKKKLIKRRDKNLLALVNLVNQVNTVNLLNLNTNFVITLWKSLYTRRKNQAWHGKPSKLVNSVHSQNNSWNFHAYLVNQVNQ